MNEIYPTLSLVKAIGATKIADRPNVFADREFSMSPRHLIVIDRDVGGLISTNNIS